MNKLMINSYFPKVLHKQSESGFAAFAVTLILTIVLSLIVLGFAANSRAEQSRTLETQLNAAAYYAAESGINDAYNIIKTDLKNGTAIPTELTCSGSYLSVTAPATSGTLATGSSSGEGSVAYTCLLVNPYPSVLEYRPVDAGQGQVVPLFGENSGAPEAISSITINWQEDGVSPLAFTGCPPSTENTFSALSTWASNANCTAGVLQVDIVLASGWSSVSSLQSATKTVFLEPQNTNETAPQPVINGNIIPASCTPSTGCTVTLDAPPSPSSSSCSAGGCYYLRLVPIYDNADISVTPNTSVTGLINAQAAIDSTGRASDQLKRIQEYVSINQVGNNTSDIPVNALQSQTGVCKVFSARPGFTSGPGSC
jgi:Tfp pilus assembly protein PilX